MAQGTEVPEFKRRFGYNEIVWEIKNYFAAICQKNWTIESPDFTVRSNPSTKWRLYLSQGWGSEKRIVFTTLKRLDTHPYPEYVIVKWFLTLRYDGKDLYVCEDKNVFGIKDIASTLIKDIDILENNMLSSSSSLIAIRCRMIVYNRDSEIYKITDDIGLKDLSQSMRILFRVHPNSDLKIRIGNEEIEAHKAVLCARNKNLRTKIEEDGDTIEYEHLKRTPKGLASNLIGYLYTADLNFILRTPSFSLEDLIDFFKIKELKSYFLHDEMTIATIFESNVLKFTWLVMENSETEKVCIRSPLWKLGKLTFQLVLYPKFQDNEDKFFSLFGEFGRDSEPNEAYFACSIEGSDGSFSLWKGQAWSRINDERFGFENFYYCNSLEKKKAILRRVRIKCTLFIPTGAPRKKSIIRCKVGSIVSNNKDRNYIQLSNDLLSLFETGKFSDITIASNEFRFQAHKAILSCRSHIMNVILSDNNFNGQFLINDYTESVLRALIRYVYCGIMQDHELNDLRNLYTAANNFRILSLKYYCSSSLQRNLNAENVLENVVFSYPNKDLKLRYSAFKFICLNLKQVYNQNDWSVFEEAHPVISREFMQYLKMFILIRNGIDLPHDFTVHDFIINILQ